MSATERLASPPTARFLTALWRDLVMLNYEVDPAVLAPLVPIGTELDLWEGRALISVVGFHFRRTRVLGLAKNETERNRPAASGLAKPMSPSTWR